MTENAVAIQSPEHALLELTLVNAESSSTKFADLAAALLDRGVPAEVVTRLEGLWDKTQVVAGEIIAVGRIVLAKVVEFIQANPAIAAGLAVGAAFAAFVAAVPFLGPLIAPFVTPVAIVAGGAIGANLQRGHDSGSIPVGVVDLARKFFALLIAIFQGVSGYWAGSSATAPGSA